jgi:hypothetical protein
MDVAYKQHANAARRKNRSTTNLNHLTLAPLTSKLPLNDADDSADPLSAPPQTTSYLQGKSAPTTPRLLSRSPGPRSPRSHSRGASTPSARLPKSKSTTLLNPPGSAPSAHSIRHSASGATSPTLRRRPRGDDSLQAGKDRSDTDWLLRAGALISSETRDAKGQSWLVSRESSTSLTGMRDADEAAFDRELARERELNSQNASRRGSIVFVDDDQSMHLTTSPPLSRIGSRPHSRVGSRSQLLTPSERRSVDGYFSNAVGVDDDLMMAGPDFVNLDENLEASAVDPDTSVEDEAHVRRLVKRGNTGVGTWFGNVLGFQLFSVEENDEESDADPGGDGEDETTEGEAEDLAQERRKSMSWHFEGVTTAVEDKIPPPKADEGGWQDAAWLLTVASKVLL